MHENRKALTSCIKHLRQDANGDLSIDISRTVMPEQGSQDASSG